jgi:hypothetical protein
MGPNLLLDKSSLQSISRREASFLFRHYNVVLTSILITEILGDLKKGSDGNALSKEEVKWLAQKILATQSYLCAPYRQMCAAALFGEALPMDLGQVPMAGGTEVQMDDGKRGVFFDEPPEMQALRNWEAGKFSEAEIVMASKWREATQGIDLEFYKKNFKAQLVNFRPAKTFDELAASTARFIDAPQRDIQMMLLQTVMDEMRFPPEWRVEVSNRWMKAGMPPLKDFAPYAGYYMRTRLTFEMGLASGLITTRPTNRVDLVYLYYLPFCMVFSSGDKLHENIAPGLMRKNQMFVRRDDLKGDLKWLADDWDALTEEQRKQRHVDFGFHPPESKPDSVTLKVWQKFCKPRTPGSGDLTSTLTPEQNEKILAEVKKFMAAVKRAKGTDGPPENQ